MTSETFDTKDMEGSSMKKHIYHTPVNHKGSRCVVNAITFCQEGYCSNCQIYLDWVNNFENKRKHDAEMFKS